MMTAQNSPRQSPEELIAKARDRASDAYDSARERAIEAYDSARETAAEAKAKAGQSVSDAPFVALGAGLAAGALIAALLPRTKVEERVLGPVGQRLSDTAKAAAGAAREAGAAKLGELNLTRDAGSDALSSILKGAGEAAKSSAQAALGTVRGKA